MSRLRWLLAGGGLLGLVLVVLAMARGPESAKAAAEQPAFGDKMAIKVTMRTQGLHFEYLEHATVRRIGGRDFIGGHRLAHTEMVWLPVDQVSYIDEYGSVDEL